MSHQLTRISKGSPNARYRKKIAEFKEALKEHHDTPALLSRVKSWFKNVTGS
jgi:hypothetical protein